MLENFPATNSFVQIAQDNVYIQLPLFSSPSSTSKDIYSSICFQHHYIVVLSDSVVVTEKFKQLFGDSIIMDYLKFVLNFKESDFYFRYVS